jgi:hypothetical protein
MLKSHRQGALFSVFQMRAATQGIRMVHRRAPLVSDSLNKKVFCSDAVRIRVRIDPPHPLVCRKRRLNGAVLRMRPEKPRPRVTAGVAR